MGGHLEIWPYHSRHRRPRRSTARVCQYARHAETHRIPPSYDAPVSRRGPHLTFLSSFYELPGGLRGYGFPPSTFVVYTPSPGGPNHQAKSCQLTIFPLDSVNRSFESWYCHWPWLDRSATPSMNLSCADPSFLFTFSAYNNTNTNNIATFRHLLAKTIPSCTRMQDSFVYDWRSPPRVATPAVMPKVRCVSSKYILIIIVEV